MSESFKVTKFIAKLVTGFALLGTILFSLAQIYIIQSDAASKKIFTEPEAILLIQFKTNTKTKTIVSELPKNENYGIVYHNNLVSVNKAPFPIEQTGEFVISNFEKSIKTETDSFLKNLEYAKNKGTKSLKALNNKELDKGAKETLQNSLNKFSLKDLKSKNSDDYYKSANSQIMVLVGNKKELDSIKSKLTNQKKNISNTNYIDKSYSYTSKEIKAKQTEVKSEIEKLKKKGYSEEKATREVMQKFLSQYLTKDQLNQVSELSKETVAKVNKIIKTDIAGNKFTIEKDLKSLKLTDKENKSLQSLLKLFNNRPEEIKNDVQSILKTIKKDTPKPAVKKTSALENATSLLTGNVEVNAWCEESYYEWYEWWGARSAMNSCRVDKVVYDITVGGIFSGVAANVVCYALGLTFWLGLGCVAATAVFAGYFAKLAADLQYNVKSCGWVWYDTTWYGWFNVYPAC